MEYYKDGVRQNNPSIPNVSNAGHDEIIEAGWIPVEYSDPVSYNPDYEKLVETGGEIVDGKYVVTRVAEHKTQEELKRLRESAYKKETDGLYFKSERGEVDVSEWLDAVQEIHERYPYPEAE